MEEKKPGHGGEEARTRIRSSHPLRSVKSPLQTGDGSGAQES